MNAAQVRIDVDVEGHLTVVVDDHEWAPPTPGGIPPEVPLGRSDVPWVLDSLLTEHGRPLDVVLHDRGRTFRDLVVPEHLKHGDPSYSPEPPGFATDRRRPPPVTYRDAVERAPDGTPPPKPRPARGTGSFEAGGYTPGEQVSIAVIVTRLTADDHGRICLILPAALRPMIGDAVAIGEESREIHVNQAGAQPHGRTHWTAALDGAAPGPSTPAGDDLNLGFRRQSGSPDLGM